MNPKADRKLDNLTKLRIEKNRLRDYCTYQEKLIGIKIGYFRQNYPEILGESLLPYDETQNVKVSSLLDAVNGVITKLLPGIFEGRFLPSMALKLVQVMMINLINKKK
jgi:hypothetical protein